MSVKRFFTDNIADRITLTGDEHKHLSVVLRARVGEEVVLCSGDGYDNFCEIVNITKTFTELKLLRRAKNEGELTVGITLFSSLLKGDKNDFVVQKATELGVSKIYPVITKYVQAHDRSPKTERLNKIALEAAKQCGRAVLTKVYDPINFAEAVKLLREYDLTVFAYENATEPSLKQYLSTVDKSKIKTVAILIGSEGGFASEEADELKANAIVPLTLGKRIMRAETANIAVLSAVAYELEQWQ